MSDDLQQIQAGSQPDAKSVLGIALFDAFARALRFVGELAGNVISVENGIIASIHGESIIHADMNALAINVMPMSIYRDMKCLRGLGRIKEGVDVTIRHDASNAAYQADNGQMVLPIGKCAPSGPLPNLISLQMTGFAQEMFQPSTLKMHIGTAQSGFLSLYDDQLEQITPDGTTPFTFNSIGAYTLSGKEPDLKLSARCVFKALRLPLKEMSLNVGKHGDDYFVDFTAEVTHMVTLHLQEKAEII
jgi:hypothetical protein